MECIKDCCKNLMKVKVKEQETQGELMSCAAVNRTAVTDCSVSHGWFPPHKSDHAEDASSWGSSIRAGAGSRENGGHRRLPPVQAAPGWQRGAVCPADLQGLLRPTQRFPFPQLTVWATEYVATEINIVWLFSFRNIKRWQKTKQQQHCHNPPQM